ncbi:unnamed protein product [Durusdinium trenchii]|uniref:Uncharacterized protein n=2 Tax=Durusdinium trenchii TaxID=1381693 RepID=A0ABP0Q7P1_9DINO
MSYSGGQLLRQESDSEDEGCNFLSFRCASLTLLGLFAFTITYHVLILSHVVPYKYVWGGRLKSESSMLHFETVSLSVNLLLVVLVLLRGGFCCQSAPQSLLRGLCLVFSLVFALNTVGNLLASSWFEMLAFTPVTLLASVAFFRLYNEPK